MTAPPGTAPTSELFGEHITDARDADLGSANGQMRYLVSELGITRAQAKRLIRAYEHDLSDAERLGNDTGRSDTDFLAWLMAQAPGGRRRSVCKRDWRVAS